LGASRREWFFTSGGTEANNTVLRSMAELPRPVHVVASPIEHPSILRCCEWLRGHGVAVSLLPVAANGVVQVEALAELLRPETRLVTLMAANNETGVLQPVQCLAALLRQAGRSTGVAPREQAVLLHSDAVQAFGRVPLPAAEWGLDAVTVAAHKLGGPKGVGGLLLREGVAETLPALLLGGQQERSRRAGTESVFLAEGFRAAAEWVFERLEALAGRLAAQRDRLEQRLAQVEGFFVNGAGAPRVPNTTNLGFAGVSAQSLLVALDLHGVAVSTGSACSSGAMEPSHVLTAMGLEPERVASSLRISLGWATQDADVDRCAEVLLAQVRRLRARRSSGK
ncbi:MAG TPA: cysteine desulfurase family protein, partial [bacterium]|nr:cysteine desulfurase family protein [bacterium]